MLINMKIIGIYKITSPNGRIYIGQSRDFKNRTYDYVNSKFIKKQTRLYNSFKKYGPENHILEFIEECLFEELNIFERKWQDYYNVLSKKGLNCILTETDALPRMYSTETLLKLKLANTSHKNPMFGRKGINHPRSRKVINIETGEIFDSLQECCVINYLNPKYMSRVLSESRKNKTNFLYFKENGNYFSKLKYKPVKKIKIKKSKEEIYYNRSNAKLGNKNPMYNRKGKDNPASKKVIDIELNIIYDSLKECCEINKLNPKYMSRWLNNSRPNKAKYRYV